MKKTKMLPPVLALTAAAVTGVIGLINKVDSIPLLLEILVALLVFFFLGEIAREVLDMLNMPAEDAVSQEGEVIEKEPNAEETTEAEERPQDNPQE